MVIAYFEEKKTHFLWTGQISNVRRTFSWPYAFPWNGLKVYDNVTPFFPQAVEAVEKFSHFRQFSALSNSFFLSVQVFATFQ